jgi:hypothetical protein
VEELTIILKGKISLDWTNKESPVIFLDRLLALIAMFAATCS